MEPKDFCTWFPENWVGVYIGDCCKNHDDTLSTHSFFKCLKSKIGWFHASYITLGGLIGAMVKYPKRMFKRM